MVLPINYASEMADIQRAIEELSPDTTNCDAGFIENGTFQRCSNKGLCPNIMMDDNGCEPDFYCALERRHELRKDLRNLQYRQPMLDFYWNSKGKSDCQQFLKDSGLVTQYTLVFKYHFPVRYWKTQHLLGTWKRAVTLMRPFVTGTFFLERAFLRYCLLTVGIFLVYSLLLAFPF